MYAAARRHRLTRRRSRASLAATADADSPRVHLQSDQPSLARGSMDKYELLKDIGSGNFGVARLMRNRETKELVAMKYIPRGLKMRMWRGRS